ncbi:MAG TPA: hypothetical protein VIZ17_18420 [Acetobacteraceae bacterium]
MKQFYLVSALIIGTSMGLAACASDGFAPAPPSTQMDTGYGSGGGGGGGGGGMGY